MTALAVPFRNGRISEDDLINHVSSLVKDGVHGFFVLGSISQGPLLTAEERVKVLSILSEYADGKYVIAQVGGTDWGTIMATIRDAEKYNVTGIATIPPIYYKPDYEGFKAYLLKLMELTSLPIYIYNFPRAVGFDVTPDILERLLKDGVKVAGIKDSVTDITEIMGHVVLGINVFNGIDALLLPSLVIGAKGGVSGLSNYVPNIIVGIYKAYKEGDLNKARELQVLAYKIYNIISKYPFPSAHYSLVKLLRYDFGTVKEPLIHPLTKEEELILASELSAVGSSINYP